MIVPVVAALGLITVSSIVEKIVQDFVWPKKSFIQENPLLTIVIVISIWKAWSK